MKIEEIIAKELGFNVGDTLYVVYPKRNKVCKMTTDCFKVFKGNITVHGYVYGLGGNFGIPVEVSLKYLNKRSVFTKRKLANEWLEKKLKEGENSCLN